LLITPISHDNQIFFVEVLQPNKTDVLGYLTGSSAPPDRWARVAIVQSATEEALIVNFKVYYRSISMLPSFLTTLLLGWSITN
jgi:hypothetical protein